MDFIPHSNGKGKHSGRKKKKEWKRPYIADRKLIPRLQEVRC